MAKDDVERGAEAARRLERSAESIVGGISRESMSHLISAGMEMIQASNSAMKSMQVPKETRESLHKAQREVLLAMRSAIDVVLAEVDKEMPPKKAPSELKKIEVRKKGK